MAIEEGDEFVDFKAFKAAMADALVASGDGSGGKTRVERKSCIHCQVVARRGAGGAGDGSWVCGG